MAEKTKKTLSIGLTDAELAKVKTDSIMSIQGYKVGLQWFLVVNSSNEPFGQAVTVRDIQAITRSLKIVQRQLQATVRRDLVLSDMQARQREEATSKA